MKKLSLSLVATLSLVFGVGAFAAGKIIVHEKPVTIIREGEVYVVPEKTSARYYYHKVNNTQYVCVMEEPTELVGVKAMMVEVKVAGEAKKVRCYHETHFVIE